MKKYFQVFKISSLDVFEYRGTIISSYFMYFIGVSFSFFIWYKLIKDYTTVGDYNLSSIMTYYLLSGVFLGFFNEKITKHIEKWVNEGSLSQLLLKPLKISLYLFSKEVGKRISVFILGSIVFVIPLILIPSLRNLLILTPTNIIWLLVFTLFSNLFLYLLYWTLGNLAFWLINLDGVRNVVTNIIHLLKGTWFPLDLAPPVFQNIMSCLPFQYALFYPIKILTSPKSTEENLRGLLVLSISIIVLLLISIILWKKGLKNYESVGT